MNVVVRVVAGVSIGVDGEGVSANLGVLSLSFSRTLRMRKMWCLYPSLCLCPCVLSLTLSWFVVTAVVDRVHTILTHSLPSLTRSHSPLATLSPSSSFLLSSPPSFFYFTAATTITQTSPPPPPSVCVPFLSFFFFPLFPPFPLLYSVSSFFDSSVFFFLPLYFPPMCCVELAPPSPPPMLCLMNVWS